MPKVLVVDDDPGFTPAIAELLRELGFDVDVASSLEEAHGCIEGGLPDALLIDLLLPDGSGLELIESIDTSATRVIVITGHPSVDRAVKSLRAHVHEFLIKPIDVKQLTTCLTPLLEDDAPSAGETRSPKPGRYPGLGPLVGDSPVMRSLFESIEKVAPSDAGVLLIGESGTGKELVAQAIHELSPRAARPFLAINCGAVPTELIASELFGHERGSFTGATRQHRGYFERVRNGTLFLDEITEMPAELQVNFLRVLETNTFRRIGGDKDLKTDARIVAATNRSPEEAVADKSLREDLYFRLTVFPIRLPLLRERTADIAILAEYFLEDLNQGAGTSKRIAGDGVRVLERHSWPGNVRELRNVLQRAFILADGEIGETQIDEAIQLGGEFESTVPRLGAGITIAEAERQLIFSTLEHYEGNKRATAEALGISLKTLYNRLKEYEQPDTAGSVGEAPSDSQ